MRVEFEVAADLPDYLRVGFLRPGARYEGFGRFSRSQSFHAKDGALDQRGFAFRLETDLGPQDILLSNTPVSFAPDPVMFLTAASTLVEHARPIAVPLLFVRLGPRKAVHVLGQLLRPPDRTIAFTSQRYWSRTPLAFGPAAARLMVRPLDDVRRVASTASADFLTDDLTANLRQRASAFELCALLFVDETRTPIEDASVEWREADTPPIVLGRLTLPVQDLAGQEGRQLAERVDEHVMLSPWNTPCLRPLGRTNRGRLVAYNKSAEHRGAPPLTLPAWLRAHKPTATPLSKNAYRGKLNRSPA